jgi:DNA (cytosine-5)-methyltransferase 1
MITSAISLFSVCGGSDLALLRQGYKICWSNNVWVVACQTYRDNFKSPRIKTGDIASFKKFPQAQLLVGCYPCQGYSQGGKRSWGDSINFLYREFDRVIPTCEQAKARCLDPVGALQGKKRRTDSLRRILERGIKSRCILSQENYGTRATPQPALSLHRLR